MTRELGLGDERVLYLYGIARTGHALPCGAEAGRFEVVPHSALLALAESVPAGEFSPASLEKSFESIEWVSGLARRHEAVLEQAMQLGPIVPVRVCTLFTDAATLAASLAENESRFLAMLDRFDGREEWGLKVSCDEGVLRSTASARDPEVRALNAAVAAASPGQAYVIGKQRDKCAAEVAAARIDQSLDEIVDLLLSLPLELRLRPTPRGARAMILNIAVLLERPARASFDDTVDELAERFREEGFLFEVNGPWPPYSFCEDDADSAELAAQERS